MIQQFEGSGSYIPRYIVKRTNGTYSRRSRVGGVLGESSQGIVWVDDFDLRFQKPGETTNQRIVCRLYR